MDSIENDALRTASLSNSTPLIIKVSDSSLKTARDDSTHEDSISEKTARDDSFKERPAKSKRVKSKKVTIHQKDPLRLSVVVVGDPLVGKTALIHAYMHNKSILEKNVHLFLPGVLGVQERKVQSEGKTYTLVIEDTDFNRDKRIAAYLAADIIMVCYSVADVNSFRCVNSKWIAELNEFAREIPHVLVGCKSDLREVAKHRPTMEITDEFDGIHLAAGIQSQAFLECSALTMVNVKRIFDELPSSVERYRMLTDRKLGLVPFVGTSQSRYNGLFATMFPIVRQSCRNLYECFSNPGAFVERKKTVVSYVPILRSLFPYEEDANTAKEHVHPQPKTIIQDAKLKHLFEGKGGSKEKNDSKEDSDENDEEKDSPQSKRKKSGGSKESPDHSK